jgi:hypothetical protein
METTMETRRVWTETILPGGRWFCSELLIPLAIVLVVGAYHPYSAAFAYLCQGFSLSSPSTLTLDDLRFEDTRLSYSTMMENTKISKRPGQCARISSIVALGINILSSGTMCVSCDGIQGKNLELVGIGQVRQGYSG